jgi:hypothetical protein
MGALSRQLAAALLVAASWHPALAQQDTGQHCPPTLPEETFVFTPGGDSGERERLGTVATAIAKSGRPACVLAFIDPDEPNHSKMMAFRRAVWMRDTLIGKGVNRSYLSMELRPLAADDDRANLHNVSILLGR